MSLKGKVTLVTGASRGIGRGIALQLGKAGATVYITGRKPEHYDDNTKKFKTNHLQDTADEITKNGGKGIAVFCDHSNPDEIKNLFKQIENEQKGQLDILVNNAYAGVPYLFSNMGKKFYELDPVESYDIINNVGLRNHYICACHAARLMVPRKSGLIVNISSMGGMHHLFNVSYGIGKAACDRLAADLAVELRGTGVCALSLWPGAVKTELVNQAFLDNPKGDDAAKKIFSNGESTEFSGMVIVALATDPNLEHLSGRVIQTAPMGVKYGLKDIDGTQPQTKNADEYLEIINRYRVDLVNPNQSS